VARRSASVTVRQSSELHDISVTIFGRSPEVDIGQAVIVSDGHLYLRLELSGSAPDPLGALIPQGSSLLYLSSAAAADHHFEYATCGAVEA
jgi:hypothetical protein